MTEKFVYENSFMTADGRKWPKATQIPMEPGDACIAMFHCPHSGTRNEHGTESRKSIFFRIRDKKRQPNHVVTGVSDHPDRGQNGEWLEHEKRVTIRGSAQNALCATCGMSGKA